MTNQILQWVVIVFCTVAGILLGRKGFWLPWSIDAALYSMLFYHVGVVFKKYKALDLLTSNSWMYFLLSPIWVYMIYQGGMELAVRDYHGYGFAIIGSLSGILLINMVSGYLTRSAFFLSKGLRLLGEASMTLLVVHVLINSLLKGLLEKTLSPSGFCLLLISVCVQIIVAVLVHQIKSAIKNKWRMKKQLAG